jgi:hypothetical protein
MAVQALILIVAVPLYGALAARMARRRLINVVMLFFIACLPVFYAFAGSDAPMGVAFLLWIGIFSLMVIAQFWPSRPISTRRRPASGSSPSSPLAPPAARWPAPSRATCSSRPSASIRCCSSPPASSS